MYDPMGPGLQRATSWYQRQPELYVFGNFALWLLRVGKRNLTGLCTTDNCVRKLAEFCVFVHGWRVRGFYY